jgi:hypothetical protein
MLREIRNTRQVPSEHPRRWFTDEDMDLVVWLGDDDSIVGFQLAYDQIRSEHALTWKYQSGFQHDSVDNGEGRPGKYKATPILIPDGEFSAPVIAERFKERATDIDEVVSGFVYAKLLEYPAFMCET